MKTKQIQLLLLLSIAVFVSCKKEEDPEPQPDPLFTLGKTAFIMNEGTFNQGNGEISFLNLNDLSIKNNLYGTYNNNAPLGDIAQSMTIIGDKAYVVVNNSQKIIVLSLNDFKKTATISPLSSPRYLQKVATNKAYVTDLFSNTVSIVNLATNAVSGTIPIGNWTEQLLEQNGKVFVTAPSTDKVYIIDPQTDALTDSIVVSLGANSMCTDKNNNIWVFCSGSGTTNAALHCVNPVTGEVLKTIDAGSSTFSSGRICSNNAKDSLYYIKEDVYRLSISDVSVSNTPFLQFGTSSLYGLKVKNEFVMVTDAKDFIQKGELSVYSKSGSLIKKMETGISPSEIILY